MADKRPEGNGEDAEPEVRSAEGWLLDLREMRQTKVRYGRANLTIARWGQIALSPLAGVIDRWREDEASPEEVAWAFVRARIIDCTPSFDWESADLGRLVRLVTELAHDPEIKSRTVEDLAPELAELETRERGEWEKASKAFTKNLNTLTFDATRAFEVPSLAEQFRNTAFVTTNWDKVLSQSISQMTAMPKLSEMTALPKISEMTVLPKISEMTALPKISDMTALPKISDMTALPKLSELTALPKLTEIFVADLKQFTITDAFQESFGDWASEFERLIQEEDVQGLADALIKGANDFDQAEVAAAVEGTTGVADDPDPPDLTTAVDELTGQVKELTNAVHKTKDSAAKQIMIGLAILFIWTIIVLVFARYGINLDPSQAGDPAGKGRTATEQPKPDGSKPKPGERPDKPARGQRRAED